MHNPILRIRRRLDVIMNKDRRDEVNYGNVEIPHGQFRISKKPKSRTTKHRTSRSHYTYEEPRHTQNDDDRTIRFVTPTKGDRSFPDYQQTSESLEFERRRDTMKNVIMADDEDEDEDMKIPSLNDVALSLKGMLLQCGMVEPPHETEINLRDEDFHWLTGSQSFDGPIV